MATYNPRKRYTWTPQDKFELSGDQFGSIINAFRAALGTPEAIAILRINEANDAIEAIMADAADKGIIREIPEEQ